MDDKVRNEINRFVRTKLRLALMLLLYNSIEMSQSELVSALGSSAASVSNILAKFGQFEHKLVKYRCSGKYRIYSLTDLGHEFMETTDEVRREEKPKSRANDSGRILLEAQKCIEDLKVEAEKQSSDENIVEWADLMDAAMIWRAIGGARTLDHASEEIVDRYLICVERLTLERCEDALSKALDILEEYLLKRKVERYLNLFEPFIDVINGLGQASKSLALCKLVMLAFSDPKAELPDNLLEKATLDRKWYGKLKKAAIEIKTCVSQLDEEIIYNYFSVLFLNQNALNYSLTQLVCAEREGKRCIETSD
ncbi:MAG: hypothetical protein HDT37_05250 [Clostridiales bacterium]|nr:hypothetical protein [Clostridiales bacterium]